jgi:hypothetical protein
MPYWLSMQQDLSTILDQALRVLQDIFGPEFAAADIRAIRYDDGSPRPTMGFDYIETHGKAYWLVDFRDTEADWGEELVIWDADAQPWCFARRWPWTEPVVRDAEGRYTSKLDIAGLRKLYPRNSSIGKTQPIQSIAAVLAETERVIYATWWLSRELPSLTGFRFHPIYDHGPGLSNATPHWTVGFSSPTPMVPEETPLAYEWYTLLDETCRAYRYYGHPYFASIDRAADGSYQLGPLGKDVPSPLLSTRSDQPRKQRGPSINRILPKGGL